jgi:flagellar motility protein MotE (MotC chaperone)
MKNTLIYTAAFLLVFVLTTGGIIILNESFNNIFRFDFREIQPPADDLSVVLSDKNVADLKDAPDSVKYGVYQQLFSSDTTVFLVQDKALLDSLNNIKQIIAELQNSQKGFEKLKAKNENENKPKAEIKTETVNQDSLYQVWLKKTVKFYEKMKPAEAAKIIVGYSDDIAKDIVYKMKPKQAAKILASLSPQKVQKITRVE